MAQPRELAAALNEEILLLDDEKGIFSSVWAGQRPCGKASVMNKESTYIYWGFSIRKDVLYSPLTLFCQLCLKYCVCTEVMVSGSLQ